MLRARANLYWFEFRSASYRKGSVNAQFWLCKFKEHAICQWSIQLPANCLRWYEDNHCSWERSSLRSTTIMSHCRLQMHHRHHHHHHHDHHDHHDHHLQAWDMQDLCLWRFSSLQQQGCIILHTLKEIRVTRTLFWKRIAMAFSCIFSWAPLQKSEWWRTMPSACMVLQGILQW